MPILRFNDTDISIELYGSNFIINENDLEQLENTSAILLISDENKILASYVRPSIKTVKSMDGKLLIKIFEKNDTVKNNNDINNFIALFNRLAKELTNTMSDETAIQFPSLIPDFSLNYSYKKDDRFTYNGDVYKVNQDHTSQEQWVPGETGTESLYTKLTLNDSGYTVWTKPTGAHDAYNTSDIVVYMGKLYVSKIDGNVWSPDEYPAGWELYTETTEEDPQGYPVFVQPTGAHNAYNTGDIVHYPTADDPLYKSLIDGNTWSPDAYPQGWELYTES